MKLPRPIVSTLSMDVGVRVTVNGFWFLMNCSLIGVSSVVEPSAIFE